MTRKLIIALVAAAVAFGIVQIWAGTAGFKPGLDPNFLRSNATLLAAIVGIAVGAVVYIFSENRAGIGSATNGGKKKD